MDNIINIIRFNIDLHFTYLCSGILSFDELCGYVDCASHAGIITKTERSFIFKAGLFV